MENSLTQNEDRFSARFCSSGKAAGPRRAQAYCSTSSIVDGPRTQPGSKIAAKNRRGTEIHRGHADRQACPERSRRKQRRNRKKEPPKCENCENSVPAGGSPVPTLICNHKADADLPWQVVDPDDSCAKFEQSRELLHPDLAEALAQGAKLIPLSQDKFAIVDADDYDRLSKYKWSILKSPRSLYAATCVKGRHFSMHRFILNAPPHLLCDHRDNNGLNNRKSNLRLCTHAQNSQNRRPDRNTSSKYKGVAWSKHAKKWMAYISSNGKRYHLGYFEIETDAAKAYDKKAKELFGEFAYLNFPNSSPSLRASQSDARQSQPQQ